MSYAGKTRFVYDERSQAFQAGAHKHWHGCFDKRGNLNGRGRARLLIDRKILEARHK